MDRTLECRTCLGQFAPSDILDISARIMNEITILKAIEEVASIEACENECMPRQVCQSCFCALESALKFRKQVVCCHIELKKRYQLDWSDPLFINCNEPIDDECNTNKLNNTPKGSIKTEETDFKTIYNKKKYNENEDEDLGVKSEDTSNGFDNDENMAIKAEGKSIKIRSLKRRRNNVSKPLEPEGSDSDVPLEELRKELVDLDNKTELRSVKKTRKRASQQGPRLCPICGKLFNHSQNLSSHMSVHRRKQEKPDKISCLCPDCGRVITGTRQNFVAHRRYHHSDKAQVKKRFTCDVCPRKFYREKNLIIHQRIHKGEKGYVCELCPDKSYTQIGGLILHRRKVHLKKPTCTCNYCGKQFYEKHYLETHIRQWHTGERPFSCEICGKAFSCNGTLLRHRKDSHGEKKACPKCGKMYTEGELRKHLKRHKIREEGIKRKKYTCEYCGTEMNFTSRKRHLLKQHSIMLRGRGEHAERVPVTPPNML